MEDLFYLVCVRSPLLTCVVMATGKEDTGKVGNFPLHWLFFPIIYTMTPSPSLGYSRQSANTDFSLPCGLY